MSSLVRVGLFVSLCGCGTSSAPSPSSEVHDLVILAAGTDGERRAWTVDGGRVTGTHAVAPQARRTLEADLVTPGLVDAHAHPGGLGRFLAELDLVGTPTRAAVVERVRQAEGTGWIVGRGWDQNDWTDHDGWPVAADLDVVDRPVALRRVDGHALWVNSAAMAAAGIGADTPAPPDGEMLRDASGMPSGVLVDGAMSLVSLPVPDPAEKRRRLGMALETIVRSGLVGVHEMGISDAALAHYTAIADELPVRVWVYVDPDTEAAERLKSSGPWRTGRLAVVGVKAYADGALGSRGAHLGADYADRPGHRGTVITSREDLTTLATALLGAGAQLAVHAIGDAAVADALSAYASARQAHPDRADVPLRIEHAQVVRPADRARFAALGVVASMQPTHATSDMPWAPTRLGADREHWGYAWRHLLDAGVLLAFGSDFPVERVSPAYGLWAATTRADRSGVPEGGWHPDQRLTLEEAVTAFSSAPYAAVGETGGTWAVGQPADAVLWRVEARPGGQWLQPVATVVAGRVWEVPDGELP